jgi:hypothetical protein
VVVTKLNLLSRNPDALRLDSEASDQPQRKESIMFAKERIKPAAFVAAALTLVGVFVFVAPASELSRAPAIDDRPVMENSPIIRPWGEDLSESAVDAGGIERDLDGNTRALFASDQWCGSPACGGPRLP